MSTVAKYRQIINALEQAMLSNVGVRSVTVGDQTIQFEDRTKLLQLINAYKKQLARATGRKSPFTGIDLGSAW